MNDQDPDAVFAAELLRLIGLARDSGRAGLTECLLRALEELEQAAPGQQPALNEAYLRLLQRVR